RFTDHRRQVTELVFSADGLRLASNSNDLTALVWDLRSLPRPEVKADPLTSVDKVWSSLRMQNANEAWRGMWLLSRYPDKTLSLLRKELQPTPIPDAKEVATLLTQVDDDDFQTRQQAEKRLMKMGERVAPALWAALGKKPSVETVRRLKRIL